MLCCAQLSMKNYDNWNMRRLMKITGFKKLTHAKWINLFDVSYTDKTGQERNWQVVSRNKQPKCISGKHDLPDAVLMVPFHTTEQKLVVLREYRVSLAGFQYEFPAGLIDEGESIQEASKRELMEETGLALTRITGVSPPVYNTAGLADESVVLVYCECDGIPSTDKNQGTEIIEVHLLSPADASDILSDEHAMCDVKLWMELKHYADHGRVVGM
jgi:ADP-ribose pyrophosphatase